MKRNGSPGKSIIQELEDDLEREMLHYKIFKGDAARDIAEPLIAHAFLTNPKKGVSKVVREVAALLKRFRRECK